jgi:hypothetical protein
MAAFNGHGDVGALRAAFEAEMVATGCRLKDLTVLDEKNDPFRLDTPAGHRDGQWLAEVASELWAAFRQIHLRGLHYLLVSKEVTKPNGTPYTNTDEDWRWMTERAAKSARWLGYVAHELIVDGRNSEPVVRIREAQEPNGVITLGDIEIVVPDEIVPSVRLDGWQATQPYRIALFGEKASLEPVLAPLSDHYHTDLLLPTGEASDTMIHRLASAAHEDGRPLVVLYFSDCDPSGRQMAVSVGWKLRAFQALDCPDLGFQLYPVALTPEQVLNAPAEWGIELPSTPLKDTERRADRWTAAFGIEQTEVDALSALHPDLLTQVAREAIRPWFDTSLERRMREARQAWEEKAQQALVEQLGADQIEQLRREAEEKIAELHDLRDQVKDAMYVDDLDGVVLPDPPEAPEPDVKGVASNRPLIHSDWELIDQARGLRAHKSYGRVAS